MTLPFHKTKIVCTIGPASDTPEKMVQMIMAGMDIARLNFSHGNLGGHKTVIGNLRSAARAAGRRVAVMADLPGPKMRIGDFKDEAVELIAGGNFVITADDVEGSRERVSVSLSNLPQVVTPGDALFLNDGMIQMEVTRVDGNDVHCRVIAGGELRSRKGLNIPGINPGISAFTENDNSILKFALENGVDAISQSFVSGAEDVRVVRAAAASLGSSPFTKRGIQVHSFINVDENYVQML